VHLQQLHAHSFIHITTMPLTLSYHSLTHSVCSLEGNNIGDAGAKALAAALKENTTLTELV